MEVRSPSPCSLFSLCPQVSMPTGSLCAERNVIGSALAADLTLRREDIRYVAVLSLSLEPTTSSSLLCGTCDPHDISDGSFDYPSSPVSLTPQVSCCSDTFHSLDELPSRPADMKRAMSQPVVISQQSHHSAAGSSTPNKTRMVTVFDVPTQGLLTPLNQVSEKEVRRHRESSERKSDGSNRKPEVRPPHCTAPWETDLLSRLPLANEGESLSDQSSERSPRAVSLLRRGTPFPLSLLSLAHHSHSMNPLKPCGACHEWLKKIAEVNPSFSVITFTDSECQGVYVEQIDMM
jgi:cytidine deaminase